MRYNPVHLINPVHTLTVDEDSVNLYLSDIEDQPSHLVEFKLNPSVVFDGKPLYTHEEMIDKIDDFQADSVRVFVSNDAGNEVTAHLIVDGVPKMIFTGEVITTPHYLQ